jgi:D-3-phosphoglycerate dehydrogenase / 2-oxoglutarate reductase
VSAGYLVVSTDRVSMEGLAPLLDDDRFEVVSIDDSTHPDFRATLARASGLIVRSATTVTAEMMADAGELRVIGRAGVGIDNIDLEAATERGIAVMNAPGGNTIAAAELTLALLLAVARRVPEADRSIREGRWDRSRLQGVELRGRILGVIGAGRIGGAVAERCRAFGMKVIAYDPYLPPEATEDPRLGFVPLAELLSTADVVTLHVPLTDETRGLIGAAALATMKKGAFVINASRGGVVDEPALAAALVSGVIAGAALDVYESEPLAGDSPMLSAPNLVLTPHLGASTREAQIQVALEVAAGIRAALAQGDLSTAVNAAEIASGSGLS